MYLKKRENLKKKVEILLLTEKKPALNEIRINDKKKEKEICCRKKENYLSSFIKALLPFLQSAFVYSAIC